MEMTGEYRIPAPRERVWEALNDPAVLKSCVPGCESLETTSPTEIATTLALAVGAVNAKLAGTFTLSSVRAPERFTIDGKVLDAAAGFVAVTADIDLEPDDEATVLRYTARGEAGGKLAAPDADGGDGAAKSFADAFFAALSTKLGGPVQGGSVVTTTAAAVVAEPVRIDDNGKPIEIPDAAVVDEIYDEAENVFAEAEEKVEVAAERAFLGGPVAWGFIAVAIVILLIAIFH